MGEVQRQAIFADPNWRGGRYSSSSPPNAGLAAARMQAMITYRSFEAYERKFGRQRSSSSEFNKSKAAKPADAEEKIEMGAGVEELVNVGPAAAQTAGGELSKIPPEDLNQPFSVQSYIVYQGQKFIKRFDANCYVTLTQTMDSHDISRGRGTYIQLLKSIQQPAFILGTHRFTTFHFDLLSNPFMHGC